MDGTESRESLRKQFEKSNPIKKDDNIIVDNISDVFDLAVLEMDASGRYNDPRKYYLLIYNDLKRLAREAQNADCDVIFTCWSSEFEAFERWLEDNGHSS